MTSREHRPVIDWLKTIGIALILLGHLAGRYTNLLTPPIYPKQLGVAFFIFAMGYSLSLEHRTRVEVVWNRLFEVVVWGVVIAMLVTVVSLVRGGGFVLSNYLPFVFGANVLVNNFPANPTTWYIGTYIHLLILWCVTRQWRMSGWLLACGLAVELALRWVLVGSAGLFVAYMALPNWLFVFLLGRRAGQRGWSHVDRAAPALMIALPLIAAAYYWLVWPAIADTTFPLMRVSGASPAIGRLALSCLVSALYAGWTLVVCGIFWTRPTPVWIQFLARNTLLVFIAHMPLFFWIDGPLTALGWAYPVRSLIELTLALPGLAFISECLHNRMPIRRWRDMSREALLRRTTHHAELSV